MSFGGFLKQSTAVDVVIGPFVDSTDGDSEETALTINRADVLLSKNGQPGVQKTDVTACATDIDGMYNCEFDATDTGTVGQLVLWVHVAGALLVRHEWQVVEEAIYDALFGVSATGFDASGRVDVGSWLGTAAAAPTVAGVPEVDVTHISGDSPAADNAESFFDGTGYAGTGNTIPTVTTLTGHTNQTGDSFAKFAGITLLAEWLGALFGKQVANATALTEIKATGAGSGTYSELTDSNEAIRGTAPMGSTMVGTDAALLASDDGSGLTEAGGTGDQLTAINLPNQTMDITGNLSGSVGSVTGSVDSVTNAVGSVTAQVSADVTAINGTATAAALLEALMNGGLLAQVADASATTTAFSADQFTEATDDHFNGRLLTFVTGVLTGQQTDITDYDATGHAQGTQTFVVTALTEAPANDVWFVVS